MNEIPIGRPNLDSLVLIVRGRRVLLDMDLVRLFGVSVAQIEERVRRNRRRFPSDLVFRLSRKEKDELVAACRRFLRLRLSSTLPLAFTEPGVLMLASILDSPEARAASIDAIRGYIGVRRIVASDRGLARYLDALESKYDAQFKGVFDAIRRLMEPPPQPPRPRIGFGAPAEPLR
ncbi:MAG: ORF6N domain-containing protein [Candidatus Methylomirabilis sp.]